MRKWILKLLFGDDIERFYKAFEIANECHEGFKEAHEINTRLVQDYKELSDSYLEILNIGSQVEDIEEFRWRVVELLKAKEGAQTDGSDDK